jgi:FkbM family methyltransferase
VKSQKSLFERAAIWLATPWGAHGAETEGVFVLPYKLIPEVQVQGQPLKFPFPQILLPTRTWPIVKAMVVSHDSGLTVAMTRAFARAKGAFIDVGMNAGQCLVRYATIDPSRRYLGFEPSVNLCRIAEQMIVFNRLTNAAVFPVGLWDKTGVKTFYTDNRSGSPVASAVEKYRPEGFYNSSYQVLLVSGDELLESVQLDSIALIKVDVEGGEAAVLEGLRRTIDKHKPLLYFEALPADTETALQDTPHQLSAADIVRRKEVLEVLANTVHGLDYSIAEVTEDGQVIPCDTITPNRKRGHSNYLASPRSDALGH